ncbi:NucA/NucB deoxyribonuclease domain-containing protein [Streptomyces sp. KS 21]|uniref:NucA/NucB deoxyribonuclease domain-containing protein n=1 Tax=Streptomyces sp. KS 21 TaxID=2485150 RepID=UPI0010641B6F|nr:NucA/NucB deoxyribonuclease domain-containing protein [Streptomyces sp. KS 21]TDU80675.1 deoxyribonuclease NucA/NucB [Streptomyces sp. KS 21]
MNVYVGPIPIGRTDYEITVGWQTKANSTQFTAVVNIRVTAATGAAREGLTGTIKASCKSPCTATGKAQGPMSAAGQEWAPATIVFKDAVAKDQIHISSPQFELTPTHPSRGIGKSQVWGTFNPVRCDDTMGNSQNAGCIMKKHQPIMTSMVELPQIAANIARIQAGLGGLGKPGGGAPLHRLKDEAMHRTNYEAVCGRAVAGPAPPGMSCDEYPFASASEGGRRVWGTTQAWGWVPASEQNQQGGRINAFYTQNRVLDSDSFWVRV